jgi:hypothetical protein
MVVRAQPAFDLCMVNCQAVLRPYGLVFYVTERAVFNTRALTFGTKVGSGV